MIQREGSERDGDAPRPPLVSPIEPPPSRWAMPTNAPIDESDIVALGADLEPGTLLAAYRQGLFPMPYDKRRIVLVLARPPRDHPARRAARQPLVAAQHASLRGADGHSVPDRDGGLRRPGPQRGLDQP